MSRIFNVARREFLSTVLTKGFIIGILLTPCLVAGTLLLMPLLVDESAPPVEGEILVQDPTGLVLFGVEAYLAPDALAERRAVLLEGVSEVMPEGVGEVAVSSMLGDLPKLDVVAFDGDPDAAKVSLRTGSGPLALAVIPDDAVDGPRGATSSSCATSSTIGSSASSTRQSGMRSWMLVSTLGGSTARSSMPSSGCPTGGRRR